MAQHRFLWDSCEDEDISRCRCDVDNPSMTNGCEDGGWMDSERFNAHIVAEVVKALGLREETNRYQGVIISTSPNKMHRYVTDWEAI